MTTRTRTRSPTSTRATPPPATAATIATIASASSIAYASTFTWASSPSTARQSTGWRPGIFPGVRLITYTFLAPSRAPREVCVGLSHSSPHRPAQHTHTHTHTHDDQHRPTHRQQPPHRPLRTPRRFAPGVQARGSERCLARAGSFAIILPSSRRQAPMARLSPPRQGGWGRTLVYHPLARYWGPRSEREPLD